MIITRLIGGLGNQMFQYAVARHLAKIYNTSIKLDISGFQTYKLHKYSLAPFNIQEKFASADEVQSLTNPEQTKIGRMFHQMFHSHPKRASSHICEKKLFRFAPYILKLPDNVYLDGFWQNEKYFFDISEIIRREVTVKFPQKGKDKEFADMICDAESVSLHIRRGDYVTDSKTQEKHGICSLDYYYRSIDRLTQMTEKPHLFIFSDDPQWASDNLKLSIPATFVDHNNANTNYEDLRLMRQCKHHIIANSSFSWWGAWLGENKNKLVFAPKIWMAKYQHDSKSIIPNRWIKIAN